MCTVTAAVHCRGPSPCVTMGYSRLKPDCLLCMCMWTDMGSHRSSSSLKVATSAPPMETGPLVSPPDQDSTLQAAPTAPPHELAATKHHVSDLLGEYPIEYAGKGISAPSMLLCLCVRVCAWLPCCALPGSIYMFLTASCDFLLVLHVRNAIFVLTVVVNSAC